MGPKFLLVGVIKADSVRGGASNFISWLKYLTEEKPEYILSLGPGRGQVIVSYRKTRASASQQQKQN